MRQHQFLELHAQKDTVILTELLEQMVCKLDLDWLLVDRLYLKNAGRRLCILLVELIPDRSRLLLVLVDE